MSINARIIDQRLEGLAQELRERAESELRVGGDRLKPLAFVFLCVRTVLLLDDEEAFDALTEGAGDFGVDALHVSAPDDGEFVVSLVQAEYRTHLDGRAAFPESGVEKLIGAVRALFDPESTLAAINPRLRAKVEEVRSLILDGLIPRVRILAAINGERWNAAAQETIDREGFGDQVTWELVDHDRLVETLRAPKAVDDRLRLTGKAFIEELDFKRILIGRISVGEVHQLVQRHGERIFDRNIRRYLGLRGNRVNESMRQTLMSDDRSNFYVFNNGSRSSVRSSGTTPSREGTSPFR